VKYDASKIVKEKLPEASLIFNNSSMEIEILEPTKQFGNVKFKMDL